MANEHPEAVDGLTDSQKAFLDSLRPVNLKAIVRDLDSPDNLAISNSFFAMAMHPAFKGPVGAPEGAIRSYCVSRLKSLSDVDQ